jgi:Spx/MgsR family transcriptional regulator
MLGSVAPGNLAEMIRQTMTITLYGIPNCDTVKKARTWLDGQGIAYAFHDYKKAGITAAKLKAWCKVLGWETVLNRVGTTFKKLPDAAKSDLDQGKAIALMVEQPSMIKRPIVEHDGGLLIGFKQPEWEAALGK